MRTLIVGAGARVSESEVHWAIWTFRSVLRRVQQVEDYFSRTTLNTSISRTVLIDMWKK